MQALHPQYINIRSVTKNPAILSKVDKFCELEYKKVSIFSEIMAYLLRELPPIVMKIMKYFAFSCSISGYLGGNDCQN